MTVTIGAAAVAPLAHADPPRPDIPAPAPADPGAPPADPAAPPVPDPGTPAPDAQPAPDAARQDVAAGGFSYELPPGWTVGDATTSSYGQALLIKTPEQGATSPADTAIIMGKLDLRLFAGAEPDNAKAAVRLASDMGQFYMPFQGVRINQHAETLNAGGAPGAASYYEVKFNDTTKPNGQIWAAAIGSSTLRNGTQPPQDNRWFVTWLGTANDPVDTAAAKALAESIRPYAPPSPPEPPPPDPNGPPSPADGPPPPTAGPAPVGVPIPVPPNPDMMPPG